MSEFQRRSARLILLVAAGASLVASGEAVEFQEADQ